MKLNSVDRKVNVLYTLYKVIADQTSYDFRDFIQYNLDQIDDDIKYVVQMELVSDNIYLTN